MDRTLRHQALYTARFIIEAARRCHKRGEDREALNSLCLAVAIQRDLARHGGLGFLEPLRMVEKEVAELVEAILAEHRLNSEALAQVCETMDRLAEMRLAVRQELVIGLMMEPITNSPGWKDLFSRRVQRAAAVTQYAEVRGRLSEIFDLPPYSRVNEASRRRDHSEKAGRMHEAQAWDLVGKVCYQEVFTEMNFALMRLGLAIAWYNAEKSEYPITLESLVPKYLAGVPICALSGEALRYVSGHVWSVGFDGKDDAGKPISKELEDYKYIGWKSSPIPGDVVWKIGRK